MLANFLGTRRGSLFWYVWRSLFLTKRFIFKNLSNTLTKSAIESFVDRGISNVDARWPSAHRLNCQKMFAIVSFSEVFIPLREQQRKDLEWRMVKKKRSLKCCRSPYWGKNPCPRRRNNNHSSSSVHSPFHLQRAPAPSNKV